MMIFEDKTVLVTGGTGSMGRTFVRRVLTGEAGTPKKVVVFSRDEAKQHYMRMSYLNRVAATDEVIYRNFMNILEFRIGDIRDYGDVCAAVKASDIVVNAAALKQVPTCEYFPTQAVMTNCIGATNIARAIEENGYPVESVIAVSTDKACKPVNVMGMTKSIQERIFTAANILNPETSFICVRYGNVLASRGSVIPLFHEQIRQGGPITITTPEMTRFLLSLDRAVDTVFEAIRNASPGETYVPKIPAARIVDVARALIGDRDIKISEIGIRPGEKVHECLVSEEEGWRTHDAGDYYVIQPILPELRKDEKRSKFEYLNREYSSEDAIISLEEVKKILEDHNLTVGHEPVTDDEFLP